MNDPVEFPEDMPLSNDAVDFVKGLLTRDVSQRLGATKNDFRRLQEHPWFKGIAWDKLEAKQAEPPFIPDVNIAHRMCPKY